MSNCKHSWTDPRSYSARCVTCGKFREHQIAEELDAALTRESELQEELKLAKQLQRTTDAIVMMVDGQRDHWIEKCRGVKQRLTFAEQRVNDLEHALAGMLFAFDDGVGLAWSESLLDFARMLIPAKEFTPTTEGESLEYDHRRDLQAYFGLSYASWLTIPRVLMQAMPAVWQSRIAELLNEYDDAIKNPPDYGTTVRTTVNGKIVKTPEWMTNYRHPDRTMIAHVMAIKEETGDHLDAN